MARLLVICHGFPPYHGGAENAAYYLAREAARAGHEVRVLTSDLGGRLPRTETREGCDIWRVPAPKRRWAQHTVPELLAFLRAAHRRLPALLGAWRPDWTLAHFTLPAGELARRIKRRWGVPYAVHLHGADVPGYRTGPLRALHVLLAPWTRRVWREADRVFACSGALRDLALQTWPGGRIDVLGNGVDTELFHPPASREPTPGAPLRITAVGQLIERKGFTYLLQALAQIEPAMRQVIRLDIYGTGPCEAALKAQCLALGLAAGEAETDIVNFHGVLPHDRMAAVLSSTPVFVLPSLQEGLPLALLEAMACGTAVIATAVGGIPEVVRDGVNGLLVPPADATALARALQTLVRDAHLRQTLGTAARATAEQHAWRHKWAEYAACLQTSNRPTRFLLLAGDVRWNCGDRAIRAGLVNLLRQAQPNAELWTLSRAPQRDEQEFGVHVLSRTTLTLLTTPLRRRFAAVIWGGGQLLQDDSSKLKNAYWAFWLAYLRHLARLPIIGCGLGIGPNRSRWGQYFARRALRALDQIAVRDAASAEEAHRLTGGRHVLVVPDLAIAVEAESPAAARDYFRRAAGFEPSDGLPLVGVVVRRWFHLRGAWLPATLTWRWHKLPTEPPLFQEFQEHLVTALARFAARQRVRYVFFPFSTAPWDRDDKLAETLAAQLGSAACVLPLDCSPAMLKALLGQCELVISGRFHGALLAMAMGRPVVGLSYADKMDQLFARLGQQARCLSVATVAGPQGAGVLAEALTAAWQTRAVISEELAARWAALAADLRPCRELIARGCGGAR